MDCAKVAELELATGDVGAVPMDVPQESGAGVSKPFAECNLEELLEAVKHKRKPLKPAMPPLDVARFDFIRESFSRHSPRTFLVVGSRPGRRENAEVKWASITSPSCLG